MESGENADSTQPRKGGILRSGNLGGSSNDDLDPRKITDSVVGLVSWATYNQLVEIDDHGKACPELAESWEAKADATEWLINLRQGVQFHHGKELDASDVIYSLNLHRGDSNSGGRYALSNVKDIKKTNSHQIRITLNEPNADMQYALSDYHLMIVPDGWNDWLNPVGTGAFSLDKFEPGKGASGTLNPNYWKEGRGHLAGYEVTTINDFEERLDALKSGRIDMMNRVDRSVINDIEALPELDIVRSAGGQHFTLPMLCDRPPFDNPHLRAALKLAIDREAIVENVLHGNGRVGNDHPVPHYDTFFNSELPIRPYDPDKAKYYLNKAGFDNFSIDLETSQVAFTEAPETAEEYQQHAAKAGIDINVKLKPANQHWNEVWMKAPLCMSFWGGRPTADMTLSTVYKSNADWNEAYWSNEKFDRLLLEARSLVDEDKRRPIYWELQEMVHEDGGSIIPMFTDFVDCKRKGVKGLTPSTVFELSGLRAMERCWLDD